MGVFSLYRVSHAKMSFFNPLLLEWVVGIRISYNFNKNQCKWWILETMKITLKMSPFNISDLSMYLIIGLKKYILPWYTLYTNFGSFNEYIMAGRSYYWESLKLEHDYCVEQANGSQFDHKSRFLSTKKKSHVLKVVFTKKWAQEFALDWGRGGVSGILVEWRKAERIESWGPR